MAAKAECGTFTAYKRHKRNHEPVDEACAAAAREQKNARRESERQEAAERARGAAEAVPDRSPLLIVLEEIQKILRAQMLEAPPQSVAAIARELRNVSAEIASLDGESRPTASTQSGGGVDDLAHRRAERQKSRGAAASG